MATKKADAGTGTLAGKDSTPEERSEAARAMGRARTERKRAAAQRVAPINGLKGGRPKKKLADVECRCDAGLSLEGHRWNCPRGIWIKRRQKAGEPIE